MLYCHLAMGKERIDGVAHLVGLHQFDAVAIVHAAFIAKTAVMIENEGVWRGLWTVGVRHRLRFPVVQVRIGQKPVLSTDLHLFKAVAHVRGVQLVDGDGLGIVGLNRNHRNTAVPIVRRQLRDTPLIHLRDRTMVAGKHDYQDLAGGIVGELVNRSVDAGKFKVRRRRTDCENRMRLLCPHGQCEQNKYEDLAHVISPQRTAMHRLV